MARKAKERRMMRFRHFISLAISTASFVSPAPAQSPHVTASEVFQRVKNSVVLIMGENQKERVQGSGFIAAPDRVVTNYHVVGGQEKLAVKFSDGIVREVVRVAVWDRERDLALLEVPTGSRPPLILGSERSLHEGDDVLAIGAPLGLELTITNGIVSSFRVDQKTHLIQTTTPIAPGSSGGPLLDSSGKVVGITTFGISNNPGLYFSVAVSELKRFGFENASSGADDPPKAVLYFDPGNEFQREVDRGKAELLKCSSDYAVLRHSIIANDFRRCDSKGCTVGQPPPETLLKHNGRCPFHQVVPQEVLAQAEAKSTKEGAGSAPVATNAEPAKPSAPTGPFVPPVNGWARVHHYNLTTDYYYILLPRGPDSCHFQPLELRHEETWGVLDCLRAGRDLFFVVESDSRSYLLEEQKKTPPDGEYASTVEKGMICIRTWKCYQILAEIRPAPPPSH
jgi:hypothetical protein